MPCSPMYLCIDGTHGKMAKAQKINTGTWQVPEQEVSGTPETGMARVTIKESGSQSRLFLER